MFSVLKSHGRLLATNLVKYLCDTEDDVANLPVSCSAGSLAYVIATGKKYILNNAKVWVEKVNAANSGSSSGSGDMPQELSDPEVEDIFNS